MTKSIQTIYEKLLETYSLSESNYIITNSLAILGDKKVQPSKETKLSEINIARINKYKYPERLISLINTTVNKTEEWANSSFMKLALQ